MEWVGEHRIDAAPEAVWRALNDPDVLRRALPGCRSVARRSATEFEIVVEASIGPVSAAFECRATLSDLDPPRAYTISGEGRGGVAGFARGSARVVLEPAPDGATLLRYSARGRAGGKLARVGDRLVRGRARKLVERFLRRPGHARLPGARALSRAVSARRRSRLRRAGANGPRRWAGVSPCRPRDLPAPDRRRHPRSRAP